MEENWRGWGGSSMQPLTTCYMLACLGVQRRAHIVSILKSAKTVFPSLVCNFSHVSFTRSEDVS